MPLLRIDYILRIVNNKTNTAVHLVLYFSFVSLFALPVVSRCLIKLSFCLTICLSFFLFFCFFCLSLRLYVFLSVLLSCSLDFYVCLSICLSVFLSDIVSMFVCLPTFLSVCLSVSLYLSPFLVCLSVVYN